MLQLLKDYVYQRSLNNRLPRKPRPLAGRGINLNKAHSVGIYFDATRVDDRQTVLQFAQRLREQGKRVQMLGFFQHAVAETEFSFNAFSTKDVDWAGRPKGLQVDAFLSDATDLFIALTPQSSRPLEFIARLYPSVLSVGPVARNAHCFDLMLDFPTNTKVKEVIEQIERILNVTNVQSEPVTA